MQNAKKSFFPKKYLLVPTRTYGGLDGLVAKVWSLIKALLDLSRVLNSKCPKPEASKDYLN